jgi:hypothetical protein
MGLTSGAPGIQTTISPLGFIPGGGNLGIICFQGITKRGERGKQYLCGTWGDFLNQLGGLRTDNDFPLWMREALNRGAKMRVSRAFHYTDIDDLTTADGTKATGTITIPAVVEVLATGTFTITGGTSSPGVNKVNAVMVNGVDVLGAAVDWVTSHADTATAVAAQITSFASTPNYTAAAVGAVVTITAVAGSGATPNGFVVSPTVAGDVTVGSITNMSGGVTAVILQDADFDALEVGDGYNGTVITIAASADNVSGNVDITVDLPDALQTFVVKSVSNATTTAAQIAALNKRLKGAGCQVVLTGVTANLPIGTVTLAGGVQTIASIVDADVNGSSAAKNGWHSFDNVTDSMRLWNVAFPNPAVNQGVADYCDARKDMTGMGRMPYGLTIQGMNDYRDGEGAFSHSPVDSYRFSLWETDGFMNNPNDPNDTEYEITALGHMAGGRTKADDEKGPWWSIAEEGYNQLTGINDVPINLGAGGNSTQWGVLYEKGVNAVINDEAMGVIPIGNRTTLRNKNSLLSKLNIADGTIYVGRNVGAIARRHNFKPNHVRMFNLLYRKVRPFIVDVLIKGEFMVGDGPNQGEGVWWHWIGDQFAKDLNGLKWNNKNDVDAGIYKVRFAYKPIASNEYIVLDLAPADSITILNVSVLLDPFN